MWLSTAVSIGLGLKLHLYDDLCVDRNISAKILLAVELKLKIC